MGGGAESRIKDNNAIDSTLLLLFPWGNIPHTQISTFLSP
jgi:hypothetical protein